MIRIRCMNDNEIQSFVQRLIFMDNMKKMGYEGFYLYIFFIILTTSVRTNGRNSG